MRDGITEGAQIETNSEIIVSNGNGTAPDAIATHLSSTAKHLGTTNINFTTTSTLLMLTERHMTTVGAQDHRR